MAEPRAQVRNASSERQIRRADRKAKELDDRKVDAMRQVLAMPVGRRLVWELLRMSRIYERVWDPDPLKMAFNAGQQDYGQDLLDLCLEANTDLYMVMEREARAWMRREDRDTDASHAASAENEEPSDDA